LTLCIVIFQQKIRFWNSWTKPMKSTLFSGVISCSLLDIYGRFWGTFCLNIQVWKGNWSEKRCKNLGRGNTGARTREQHVPSKRRRNVYHTTRRQIPESSHLHIHRYQNFKSHENFQNRKETLWKNMYAMMEYTVHLLFWGKPAIRSPAAAELSFANYFCQNQYPRCQWTAPYGTRATRLFFLLVFVGREGRLWDDCQGSKVELFIKNDFLVYLLNCP
jgi:hypothetical protein